MVNQHNERFSDLVGGRLLAEEEQSLWVPTAQEFDRADGGPDAAKEHLDAEHQHLQERVTDLLAQVKEVLVR